MERIAIADSGVRLTKVGLGCARLTGGSEFKSSIRLVEAALVAGIRHFDTAPVYGLGQSEGVLGEALEGVPDVTIATKVGIARPDQKMAESLARMACRRFLKPLLAHVPGVKAKLRQFLSQDHGRPLAPRQKLGSDQIRRELEESLKRLRRDRVDLYFVHEPDQFELDDEALETFIALRRKGVIGDFGLAYSRCIRLESDFGGAIQGRYCGEVGASQDHRTRIYHGVLRHGWIDECTKAKHYGDVGAYFQSVLDHNQKAGFLVSVSTTQQIRQLMAMP
jgi:aryl-alcohol dehydrogenase-like predicted oxidoreductase